jgi:adenylate kinase family enzyme
MLERRGLWNQHCVHFDFGHELRRTAAAGHAESLLTPEELRLIRQLLRSGALLEDEHFPIARKILRAFLRARCSSGDDIILLNGLPRHLGQAAAIGHLVRVTHLIHLIGSPDTILQRIRTNVGGDRTGRVDDTLRAVRRKLAIFEGRTKPLIAYYRSLGIPIIEHSVTPAEPPDLHWLHLERLIP